jgi:hypothetical protein
LQGTQSRHTEANLAIELQLPTHGRQSLNLDTQNPTPKKKKKKTAFGGFVFLQVVETIQTSPYRFTNTISL